MSKDHVPSDFSRSSGYKSDLEKAETGPMIKSVNTSFGSKNHNAYIMRSDGTHEHFYYSPKTQKSGWHGHKYPTRNNHPDQQTRTKSEGAKSMDKNAFLESIKADKATIEKTNQVSKNAAKNMSNQSGKKGGQDNGGRERGDTGPLSQGRESGNKGGPAPISQNSSGKGQSSNGQNSSSGHSSGGQAASSGHSFGGSNTGGGHGAGSSGTGGHGSGGQGGGGHGSSGGSGGHGGH